MLSFIPPRNRCVIEAGCFGAVPSNLITTASLTLNAAKSSNKDVLVAGTYPWKACRSYFIWFVMVLSLFSQNEITKSKPNTFSSKMVFRAEVLEKYFSSYTTVPTLQEQ